jgi:hypothetical protein
MGTKLTLRMEKEEYSSKVEKPVSKIVSDMFKVLCRLSAKQTDDGLTPAVRKLKGILKDSKVGEEDYKKYLEEKYLLRVLFEEF